MGNYTIGVIEFIRHRTMLHSLVITTTAATAAAAALVINKTLINASIELCPLFNVSIVHDWTPNKRHVHQKINGF